MKHKKTTDPVERAARREQAKRLAKREQRSAQYEAIDDDDDGEDAPQ